MIQFKFSVLFILAAAATHVIALPVPAPPSTRPVPLPQGPRSILGNQGGPRTHESGVNHNGPHPPSEQSTPQPPPPQLRRPSRPLPQIPPGGSSTHESGVHHNDPRPPSVQSTHESGVNHNGPHPPSEHRPITPPPPTKPTGGSTLAVHSPYYHPTVQDTLPAPATHPGQQGSKTHESGVNHNDPHPPSEQRHIIPPPGPPTNPTGGSTVHTNPFYSSSITGIIPANPPTHPFRQDPNTGTQPLKIHVPKPVRPGGI